MRYRAYHHKMFNYFYFRFVVVDRFFDGAVFNFEEKPGVPIKIQYQVDGQGWEDMNESSYKIELINGCITLTSSGWKVKHFYDVRVLFFEKEKDLYTGVEYYGCSVKSKYHSLFFDKNKTIIYTLKSSQPMHLSHSL